MPTHESSSLSKVEMDLRLSAQGRRVWHSWILVPAAVLVLAV